MTVQLACVRMRAWVYEILPEYDTTINVCPDNEQVDRGVLEPVL
jgi:hypothetical protein